MVKTFKLIESYLELSASGAQATYQGMSLQSVFQPIFSLCHRRIVGHEGLLRAYAANGDSIAPATLFQRAKGEPDVVHLDRVSRALHTHNYCQQYQGMNWLFLNVNPKVIVHGKYYGSFFGNLLKHYDLEPSRVVVEIIEGEIEDEHQLSESVNFYKNLGCLVAIDDFGAGHSNFERIWRLSPDIVKLDRSMIAQAVEKPVVRRVLPGIVSLIHEAGSLALLEGVETAQEAMIAMDTDVDLVQGNYFAAPSAQLNHSDGSTEISALFDRYSQKLPQDLIYKGSTAYRAVIAEILKLVEKLKAGQGIDSVAAGLVGMAKVDRCYLLNQSGIQIGSSLLSRDAGHFHDERYLPLADGRDANWFRRPYLQMALQHPGELQTTRPYLSIASGKLCVTLSFAFNMQGQTQVFCCDVDWDEAELVQKFKGN